MQQPSAQDLSETVALVQRLNGAVTNLFNRVSELEMTAGKQKAAIALYRQRDEDAGKVIDQLRSVEDSLRRDLQGTCNQHQNTKAELDRVLTDLAKQMQKTHQLETENAALKNKAKVLEGRNEILSNNLRVAMRDARIMEAHASGDYSVLTNDDKEHIKSLILYRDDD